MKIVLVSNLLSVHMLPLCLALKKRSDSFDFIVTENAESIGFLDSAKADFVTCYYREDERELARKKVLDADFVIFGACPDELIELRMKENKLSFLYSERFFKKGVWRRFIPRTAKAVHNRVIKFKNQNLFVLCASAYLPYDLSLLGFPASKCLKWGYFPECECIDKGAILEKSKNTILWAGRFLDWKHPEVAIEVARLLKNDNIDFQMNIVGEGAERENLENLISKYALDGFVKLLGRKSHDELLKLMREHRVYMFTSDFYEGWGAVLNEAMSNGCAVVASHAIGSVPFLIKDNENGRIYKNGNIKEAYKLVRELLSSDELCLKYGENAISSLENEYSCDTAAERICNFAERYIKSGEIISFESGPVSLADVLKNNWKG